MEAVGALVSCAVRSGAAGPPALLASSGIKLGRWVLAHGSFVSPLRVARQILEARQPGRHVRTDDRYRALPDVYVSYEQAAPVRVLARPSECSSSMQVPQRAARAPPADRDREVPVNVAVSRGKVRFMWRCELLADVVESAFSNWTMGHRWADRDDQDDSANYFLSVFVLVDIGDPSKVPSLREPLEELLALLPSQGPRRGEGVLLFGTPFGSEVLLNSLTLGVVSSCLGPGSCVLLCDASSVLGCEGGPAYMKHDTGDTRLFGMVLNSVSWCRGEWVGLTLVASLAPCLHSLLHPQTVHIPREEFVDPRELAILSVTDVIDRTVVLIKNGESYGSGISIGNGYILTCSHVVKYKSPDKLTVHCLGKSARAEVLFRTPDDLAYDLAVIHASEFTSFPPIEISSKLAVRGETVIAVGFPYFIEKHINDIRPTITKGSVTNSSPHMLQTSCYVQAGCSGGGILRVIRKEKALHCELLGLVVCNLRYQNNDTKFPNVNMAVPVAVFRKSLISYMNDPILSTLEDFQEKREYVQRLWKLGSTSQL